MKATTISLVFLAGILLCGNCDSFGQKTSRNPHQFTSKDWDLKENCNPCHIYTAEESNGTRITFALSHEADSSVRNDSTYLSGISKLCFTCHDGTIASYSHGEQPAQKEIGNDGDGHPVSIAYTVNEYSKYKLYDPNITLSGLGGTIAEDMLVNGRVECTSCHDAHFSQAITACKSCPQVKSVRQASNKSLRKANRRSSLCLTCHEL